MALPAPEDCRSTCDSSSSVVADDEVGDLTSYCVREREYPFPFDLNVPPSNVDDGEDLELTALRL